MTTIDPKGYAGGIAPPAPIESTTDQHAEDDTAALHAVG
jgi:hypothetical protein